MENKELKIGQVYKGWKYVGAGFPYRACDLCKKVRKNTFEFVHPDTPIGDNWNGFVYDDEPLSLGSECVSKFLSGKVKMPAPIGKA